MHCCSPPVKVHFNQIIMLHPPRCRQPHWLVVDGLQGGSGESFDWDELRLQAAGFAAHSSHGWLLAGGLTPDSVAGEHIAHVVITIRKNRYALPGSLNRADANPAREPAALPLQRRLAPQHPPGWTSAAGFAAPTA